VIDGVSAGYANHAVVRDVSFSVAAGEIGCVVGPNGAGKSTLLRGITRDAQLLGGRVLLRGEDISQTPGNQLVRRGLAWVPQLDDVFATLSVRENLELGGYLLPRKQVRQRVREVLDVFPLLGGLADRVAGRLSGGERKLLAIARGLIANPKLLILDEPTANLAPQIARLVLEDVVVNLAATGHGILLVEQRVALASRVAAQVTVLVDGKVHYAASGEEFRALPDVGAIFFGSEASPDGEAIRST
jgi:branched-chain amino acid transport system ATP-binding protein